MTDPHARFNDRASIITALQDAASTATDAYVADVMQQAADFMQTQQFDGIARIKLDIGVDTDGIKQYIADQLDKLQAPIDTPPALDIASAESFFATNQPDIIIKIINSMDQSDIGRLYKNWREEDAALIMMCAYYHHVRTYCR
jgi:hypothetical protein